MVTFRFSVGCVAAKSGVWFVRILITVVYLSADGVLVFDSMGETVRINDSSPRPGRMVYNTVFLDKSAFTPNVGFPRLL